MNRCIHLAWVALAVSLLCVSGHALAEVRIWKDSTGKHQTEAELISATTEEVRLQRPDGSEVTIALNRLSAADRAFVRKHLAAQAEPPTEPDSGPGAEPATKPKTKRAIKPPTEPADKPDAEPAIKLVRDVADRFFRDLRTKERAEALAALTEAARAVNKKEKSSLAGLPSPDEGNRAIRIGRAKIDRTQAAVPVQVRSADVAHQTTLHLRREDDQWRVFAISTMLGADERTIDFESELSEEKEDPLLALVGKPINLAGYMIDGTPFELSHFEGKVVLIDFWATWCGPCRAEMPNILANYQQYHDAGFEVVAVSTDKDLGDLQRFLLEEQPPWTVLADHHPRNSTSMAAAFGISGIPAFILVGKDGKVAAVHSRGKRLGQELAKLLSE
jgi:thiol-disulfide isomerase/thioredoxin